MTVLVTDAGFVPDDWSQGYVPVSALSDAPDPEHALAVDLNSPALIPREWDRLLRALPRINLIRICLRHFGDVEAFDLARALRTEGYSGRLRAHGAMLARCYTLARRAGFSEVELRTAQALLQPSEHWRNELAWMPGMRGGHSSLPVASGPQT